MSNAVKCPHCDATLELDARFCPACGKATVSTETRADVSGPIREQREMIGREIAGRFRILAKIGEGGMGAVYRGEQISLKRACAVKVLRPELSVNQVLQSRFSTEAAAVAKLDHPNTVKVYDFGQDTDGSLFIAMEYVDGASLRSVIGKGPLPPARAIGIAIQVAASLADAHQQSIVHRDLKPDNVMLVDKGRARDIVRVLDFGIAKLRDDSRSTQAAMTQAGDMLGTPQYMAPEQIRGEAIDGRTDIYALGCMIYEMVTARLPYEAPTILAMLTKHLTEVVPPPSARRPELALPPAIDQIELAAMSKDPNARPPTMDHYGEMLAAVLQNLPADPNRGASVGMNAIGAPPITPVPYTQTPPLATPSPPAQTPAPATAPYVPPPIPPTTRSVPTVRVQPPAKNRTIYVVLGVVVLGGAGVGIWAATRGGTTPPKVATGSSASAPAAETHPAPPGGEHDIPVATPDDPWNHAPDPTPTPRHPPPAPHTPQPPPPPVPTPPPPQPAIGTAEMPLPHGASLRMPAGFQRFGDQNGIMYADKQHGILIGLAPLEAGTNDPVELGARWIRENAAMGLVTTPPTTIVLHGTSRPMLAFKGTSNGTAVAQIMILFISPSYRLAFVMQAPVSSFTEQKFQTWAQQYLNDGITVP